MKTQDKINKLGQLYKATCGARDEIAVVQDYVTDLDEMHELLVFARTIASDGDHVMQRVIGALRAVLENEVHTAAGR